MDRVHSRCRTSTFVFMAVMSGKVKRLTVMGQNGYRPVASLEGVLGGMAVMRRSKQRTRRCGSTTHGAGDGIRVSWMIQGGCRWLLKFETNSESSIVILTGTNITHFIPLTPQRHQSQSLSHPQLQVNARNRMLPTY